jgi:hypothetical protein
MTPLSREKLQEVIASLLKEAKEVEVPVYGISMFPFLLPGAIVRVKQCRWEELQKGDIIFFESPPKIILHRIIKIKNEQLQCKGDSLLQPDSWIEPKQFLGRVEAYRYRNREFRPVNNFRFYFYARIMTGCWRFTGYLLFPLAVLWQKKSNER